MFHVKLTSQCSFDVIVIGGGHAGIEAASAAARIGAHTALVTMDLAAIGRLSCNPAIGGMAKGQLVCEIDALGGEMGVVADAAGIQFKTLGRSKGPAMWSPRAQSDKDRYPQIARERLERLENLVLIEGTVVDVELTHGSVSGIILGDECRLTTKSLVICSGTFLCGRMHAGETETVGGRVGERSSETLSGSLRSVGFATGRLKTGTPPRVARGTIDVSACQADSGDDDPRPFSSRTTAVSNVIDCYLTATTPETHAILRTGFDRSPMFTGRITGIGPRYCPSIEDKIDRFADKNSHTIFLEPEGIDADTIYVNGFSTSLPTEVQEAALRTIPGLEQCSVVRHGYAVEYDYFPPYQLHPTMESRLVSGLFFAGQVNGTSGYEEAAAQGLIAGINAARNAVGGAPFTLDRSQAYIGVLIDDLTSLSTDEPYRMFTSRAEYRLLLRRDNADLRLTELGFVAGLVERRDFERIQQKKEHTQRAIAKLKQVTIDDRHSGDRLRAWIYLKRPHADLAEILHQLPDDLELRSLLQEYGVREQVLVESQYEGYIQRQQEEVERFKRAEEQTIPEALDYSAIRSLSSEGREKLSRIRPRSIGQASRISGVSRSDISVLTLYLR